MKETRWVLVSVILTVMLAGCAHTMDRRPGGASRPAPDDAFIASTIGPGIFSNSLQFASSWPSATAGGSSSGVMSGSGGAPTSNEGGGSAR